MSFAFHHNKDVYFHNQYIHSKTYIIPYIEKTQPLPKSGKVLEIGCAEGGVLQAFCEMGLQCIGVELSSSKVDNARKYMQPWIEKGIFEVINQNIFDVDFQSTHRGTFDLIILKDTIEHIPNQEKLLEKLRPLLREEGLLYVGFPPWYMPWGGHQQICRSKIAMFLPYFHLLPMSLYLALLNLFGETKIKQQELKEIKETGISTHRFERIAKKTGYSILDRTLYFINPIYVYKFGLPPLKQPTWFSSIPVIRDILSTTAYYVLGKGEMPTSNLKTK